MAQNSGGSPTSFVTEQNHWRWAQLWGWVNSHTQGMRACECGTLVFGSVDTGTHLRVLGFVHSRHTAQRSQPSSGHRLVLLSGNTQDAGLVP